MIVLAVMLPMAGTIYIIDTARAHPVNVPVTKMFKCVGKWGAGAGELLAATPGETADSDRRPGER